MQESHITMKKPNEETNERAPDSMVKIMKINVALGYYDKTEPIPTSQKKGDENETQSSIKTRPEKRAKTVADSRERFEDLEKNVVNKDIPENLSLNAQENVNEQIERQRREGDQDNKQQQRNNETKANDQQKDNKTKEREVRFRLEQFYNRQRMKKQQFQAQQEMKLQQDQEPTQQQQLPLSSHFHLYPLVEKLAYAVETGTQDHNSKALVNELSSYFNKSQQMLNSVSGSLGSKNMYVDGHKQKLADSEMLLQQRRELIVEYRKSIEDILKIEP